MTYEEAISGLKKLKSFHSGSYGTEIRMAIQALERQIPKAVKVVGTDESDGDFCDQCGQALDWSVV